MKRIPDEEQGEFFQKEEFANQASALLPVIEDKIKRANTKICQTFWRVLPMGFAMLLVVVVCCGRCINCSVRSVVGEINKR